MRRTLFLAWQDAVHTRAWRPIGRLDVDADPQRYGFAYTRGAEMARREAGFAPLHAFPDLHRRYESDELFPLFRNRLLAPTREDFQDYIKTLHLDPKNADPLEILALTEGRRQTDNLEVFPKMERGPEGGFRCRFFLHGWRHLNDDSRRVLESLAEDAPLRIAVELNNPATGLAVQLQTAETYYTIGWTPRYLVGDLATVISKAHRDLQAKLVKSNPEDSPLSQRFLVELSGRWPMGYEPMSSEEFQLLESN